MSVPENKEIAYECENGHINAEHTSKPVGSDIGFRPACKDCGGRLTRQLVPMYQCNKCGNEWAYTGNAERVTCPNCRAKDTEPVE